MVTRRETTIVASFVAGLEVSSASLGFAASAFESWLTKVNFPASTKCQNNMDTIANFITIIRNGYLAKKDTVSAKHTTICEGITKLLKADGFIKDYTVENAKPSNKLILTLQYFAKNLPGRQAGLPAITGIKRISKGSVRIYSGCNKIPQVLSGAGTTIISTSKGLMTGKIAREKHLGGEVICQVW